MSIVAPQQHGASVKKNKYSGEETNEKHILATNLGNNDAAKREDLKVCKQNIAVASLDTMPLPSCKISGVGRGALKIASVFLIAFSLAGCQTVTSYGPARDENNAFLLPPTSAPQIIPGQKAFVNGYSDDVAVWSATGLFSSVQATSSETPPMKGVLITRDCKTQRKDSVGGATGFLLFLVTAGGVAGADYYDVYCDSTFFQNGRPLASSKVHLSETRGWGWLLWVLDPTSVDAAKKDQAKMCANKLMRTIR